MASKTDSLLVFKGLGDLGFFIFKALVDNVPH